MFTQVGLWKGGVAYGIALWLVGLLGSGLLSVLGFERHAPTFHVILLLVLAFVSWTLGTRLRIVSVTQGIGVGVLWVFVSIAADALLVLLLPQGEPHPFVFWGTWVRYAVLLFIPFLLSTRRHPA